MTLTIFWFVSNIHEPSFNQGPDPIIGRPAVTVYGIFHGG
jgi:hypothetical protein